VDLANRKGGDDNVTTMLVGVRPVETKASKSAPRQTVDDTAVRVRPGGRRGLFGWLADLFGG